MNPQRDASLQAYRPVRVATLGIALLSSIGCGTHLDSALIAARQTQAYAPRPVSGNGERVQEQEPVPQLREDSDPEDYVRYGLYHNPAIRAAFERWRAALERIPQVSELPDPRFTWAYFVEPIETRTGPQDNRFSFAQTFPWFGELGQRGEVAAREAEAVWWQVEAQRLDVMEEIERAWFEYAFLARDIAITGDNLELLRQLEPVVQRRVQGGGPQAELLQLQVEIGRMEDALASLTQLRGALSARLSAALNRRQPEVLPWPELSAPEVQEIDPQALGRILSDQNPELLELQERIRREEGRIELAGLEGWPDFTVGVDYFETGSALLPGVPGSGDDPWALTFSLNLPIYRGKYDAMVEEARRSMSAAQSSFADRSNTLNAPLQLALYHLDDAARKIALYAETLLPRARQSLQVTDTAYRAATVSLLDWIDRQQTLLVFEEAYWRACANYGQSLATLKALTGGRIR